jgi:hypothetical protein
LGREDGDGAGVVWGWTVQWWPGWGRFLVVEMAICCRDGHGYATPAVPFLSDLPRGWLLYIIWQPCLLFLQDSILSMFQSNPLLRPHNFHSIILSSDLTILSMFFLTAKKM